MPKPFRGIFLMILISMGMTAFSQMQLKIVLDTDNTTYKVFLKSDQTYTNTKALITTSQISIVVPHGTGNNRFLVENITSPIPNMKWRLTDRIDAPDENPEKDYLFFSFINNQSPLVLFDINAGKEILLFSFTRKGNCIGMINLVEEKNDAFWPPNSQNINIGINFTVVGAGGNAYKGNYDAPPKIIVIADTPNPCADSKVNFKVQTSQAVSNARYQWYVENQPQTGAISTTFSYEIPKKDKNHDLRVSVKMTIDESNDCADFSIKAQAVLNVKGTPNLDWLDKISNCAVLPAKLKIETSQYAEVSWEKNGQTIAGAKANELTVSENGKYAVKAFLNGCLAALNPLEIVGTTSNEKIEVNAGKDTTVLENELLILEGKSNGGTKFEWTPQVNIENSNTLTPKIIPKETTTYKLSVEDKNGCRTSDEITITVIPKLYIPNAFSPNNDGINDVWQIQNTAIYPECTIEVYNRWGNPVFQTQTYTEPWNGLLSDGQKAEVGTYFYRISTNRKKYTGVLNILY